MENDGPRGKRILDTYIDTVASLILTRIHRALPKSLQKNDGFAPS
jgi:hypothetical protein